MWKTFSTIFISVSIAEIGDKTQLATVLFATAQATKSTVFAGSAGALVLASAIGVVVGAQLERFIIGGWTLSSR